MISATTVSPKTSILFLSENNIKPPHDHCPLCVDAMIHPKEDTRQPAFIFLDMDGVMIGDRFTSELQDKIKLTLDNLFPNADHRYNDYQWTIAKGRHLHPKALENLHTLIQRIEKSGQRALVVLSTAWRNDATLQQHREEAFIENKFCKYLCGKTAPQTNETSWTPECKQGFKFTKGAKESFGLKLKSRSDVIEFWLRDHGFNLDSTNFVVIDDENDDKRKRFGERFIHTSYLFEDKHLELATTALNV